MGEIYDEGCVASQVTFNFTNAIRYNESLLVDGAVANEDMYACPDEGWACPGTSEDASVYVTCGCPYTAWVQCALDQISEGDEQQQKHVTFITCWDDQGLKDKKQSNETLQAAAANCSDQIGVDWSAVQACNGDYQGKRAQLLFAAANRFMGKWPEYTAMAGPFHVPHVLIGQDQSHMQDMDDTDIGALNAKLCSLSVDTGNCTQTIVV